MASTWAGLSRSLLLFLAHAGAAAGQHAHAHASGPSASWRERFAHWEPRVGHYGFNVTTRSAEAQRLFEIGLLLIYNFDQPNARSAFQAALSADADCAMCAWGLAHAYGPFLGVTTKPAEEVAAGLAAARNASALLARRPALHSAKERALVGAMAVRYPEDPAAGSQIAASARYAAELRRLREADRSLKEDADMLVFDAEAVMIPMCTKDGYFTFYELRGDDLPPIERPETKVARALLDDALARTNQTHAYALHMLIHLTEMSNSKAEGIVGSALKLREEMRGLQDQHLQHMVSHTFMRSGHYHDTVIGSRVAVASDAAYIRHRLMPNGPGHDSAFMVIAAMFGGERAVAYRHAHATQQIYAEMPDFVDGPDGRQAWSLPMMVALRFSDWGLVESLDATPPKGFAERWPYGYGVLRHFALGVAAARLRRPAVTAEHLQALRGLAAPVAAGGDPVLKNLTAIANHTLSAVLVHARGDVGAAVEALSRAADQEMAIPYRQPPDWTLPSRECQGQALLDAGRPQEAERVFRAALYGHSFHTERRCGWALSGLRASLLRQGPGAGREQELKELDGLIAEAWRHADVELRSPCSLLAAAQTPVLV